MKNHKLTLVIILFISILSSSCGQNNTDKQQKGTLKVKIKVTNMLPVGWGVMYRGVIDEVTDGNAKDFNDTITFGITASRKFEYPDSGDVCTITFNNSNEKNDKDYLPAINGTVSKSNEIWLISEIDKDKKEGERSTFTGTAITSNGEPLFIWDFADSEAFYLDGMKSWDSKYLDKKITVEGVLVQFIDGKSVIKDWKITDPE